MALRLRSDDSGLKLKLQAAPETGPFFNQRRETDQIEYTLAHHPVLTDHLKI